MTTKKKFFIYGLGLSLMMTSNIGISAAQYYGPDDSVQVDLGVLEGPSSQRTIFPTVQLTPPPVAEVAPIEPVPYAVPLFSSPATVNYKSGNAFADEAAMRTASRSTEVDYSRHSVTKIDTPDFVKNPPTGYHGTSPAIKKEHILKPGNVVSEVQTEAVEYEVLPDNNIDPVNSEPAVAAPVVAVTKTTFKPNTVIETKTVTNTTAFKPAAKSKQLSTIDRAMSALTAKEPRHTETFHDAAPVAQPKKAVTASQQPVKAAIVPTTVVAAEEEIITAVTPPTEVSAAPAQTDTKTLHFNASETVLSQEHKDEISSFAASFKTLGASARVTINGYASATTGQSTAQKNSLARAMAVRSILLEKGITPQQINVNASGQPAFEPYDRVDIVILH